MRVEYVSKHHDFRGYQSPGMWANRTVCCFNVCSPRTGKTFGVLVEDLCGSIRVEGPTFVWPVIKDMAKEVVKGLPPQLFDVQQDINDRYLNA